MTEGQLTIILLVIGLTLAVPTACWFGIAIGEERALQRVRQARRAYVDSLEEDRFHDNDIDAQRDWGGRAT